MDTAALQTITAGWKEQTHLVLDLQALSLQDVQQLICATYEVLTAHCEGALVPKEICKIILEMEDFLYFAALMEEKECGKGYYCWEEIRYVVNALKDGFFAGKYPYAFPKLLVSDVMDTTYLFDLKKDQFAGYVLAVRREKTSEN